MNWKTYMIISRDEKQVIYTMLEYKKDILPEVEKLVKNNQKILAIYERIN